MSNFKWRVLLLFLPAGKYVIRFYFFLSSGRTCRDICVIWSNAKNHLLSSDEHYIFTRYVSRSVFLFLSLFFRTLTIVNRKKTTATVSCVILQQNLRVDSLHSFLVFACSVQFNISYNGQNIEEDHEMQRQLSNAGGTEEDRQMVIMLPRHPLGYRIGYRMVHPGSGNN